MEKQGCPQKLLIQKYLTNLNVEFSKKTFYFIMVLLHNKYSGYYLRKFKTLQNQKNKYYNIYI